MNTVSENLARLGITLPEAPKPVAAYVPSVRSGDTLILSGQIPVKDGKMQYTGRVGAEQTVEAAQEAARICTINALAVGSAGAGGVDALKRVLKVVVYVASTPEFTDQHVVANGASELIRDIFGEAGQHARAAVGVPSLPLGSTVEIDVLFGLA